MKFSLNTKNGVPVYRQIIQQVEYNMSLGKLKSGDRLPTVRSLAVELKINPNTVAKAYNELEIRGLVNTQVGFGTFIANKKIKISEIEKKKKIDEICSKFIIELSDIGVSKEESIKILKSFIS